MARFGELSGADINALMQAFVAMEGDDPREDEAFARLAALFNRIYAMGQEQERRRRDVPLRLWPCDLILRPQAGSWVQGAFANARTLASLTAHDVVVEGNDVQVLVSALMTDAECHRAYEAALQARSGHHARPWWGQ